MPACTAPSLPSSPSAFAAFTVAMASTVEAEHACGSLLATLPSSAALRISMNMSRLLFEHAESVPRHTFTPASSIFCTGQMPDASFRFDDGLCTTAASARASSSMSLSVTCTQCASTE